MGSMDLSKMGSMADVIKYGKKLDISHAKLHLKETFNDAEGNKIIINYGSILDKYYDVIQKHISSSTLTDSLYLKYRFQPKLFCLEIYGTTELWSSLLRINNLTSVAEFTLQTFMTFNSDIFDVLNEILILEDTNIKQNNSRIYGGIVTANRA